MKRILLIGLCLLSLFGVASAADLTTGFQLDNTSTTDTVYFYTDDARRFDARYLWVYLDEDATGTVSVRRGIRASDGSITFIDDAQTLKAGDDLKTSDRNIYCFVFTKTASTDALAYIASTTAVPSNISSSMADILSEAFSPTAEWSTVVNGITIPAGKHMTFPMPLAPMGDHEQIAFQIRCTTWPDTLWYQVVATNTPTDSMTVFNFGTTEAPNYVRYIVYADFAAEVTTACEYLDNAFSEKWTPTGTDFNPSVGSYTFPIKDIAGLYTAAKYVGIRVGADVNSPIVGLRIVQELR